MKHFIFATMVSMMLASPSFAECSAERIISDSKKTFSINANSDTPVLAIKSSHGQGEWSIDVPQHKSGKSVLIGGVSFDENGETGDVLVFDVKTGTHIPRQITWIGCSTANE